MFLQTSLDDERGEELVLNHLGDDSERGGGENGRNDPVNTVFRNSRISCQGFLAIKMTMCYSDLHKRCRSDTNGGMACERRHAWLGLC